MWTWQFWYTGMLTTPRPNSTPPASTNGPQNEITRQNSSQCKTNIPSSTAKKNVIWYFTAAQPASKWSPGGIWLADMKKYEGAASFAVDSSEVDKKTIPRLKEIADNKGRAMAEVELAWLIDKSLTLRVRLQRIKIKN